MKETKRMTVRFGDLVASLYDEAAKETKDQKVQTAIVALALLDLMERSRKVRGPVQRKKKAA